MERSQPVKKPNGFTVIDHKIRFLLKLSVEEYVFVDMIYQHNLKFKIGSINFLKYYSTIGYLPERVQNMVATLKEKGLLIWDTKKNRIIPSKIWTQHFDEDELFEQLWEVHPKGTKQEAKINFQKVKAMVPFSYLIERLQLYINANEDPQYLKDLSGWLNPKMKRWENEVEYKGKVAINTDDGSPDLFTR